LYRLNTITNFFELSCHFEKLKVKLKSAAKVRA
jgi:hypothetical protein